MMDLLRTNKNLFLLVTGGAASLMGYRIYVIVMSWFVVELTGSSSLLGILFTCWAIPNMIFMLVGGQMADRKNKVAIMVTSDTSRVLVLVFLVLLYASGTISTGWLLVISIVFGISNAIFVPSRDSLMPVIVHADDLQKANSYKEMSNQVSYIAGPLIGALAVQLMGGGYAFLSAAAVILLSALLVRGISYNPREIAATRDEEAGFLQGIKDGYQAVKTKPSLIYLFSAMAVFNLGYFGPVMVGLPILSKKGLDMGIVGFSLLEVALAGGMILASYYCSKVPVKKVGTTIFLATSISGLLFAFVGWFNSLAVSMLLLAAVGGLITVINILMYSSVQKQVRPEYLGIVFGFLNFIVVGMDPVTFFLSGIAFDTLPLAVCFFIGGSLVFSVGVIGMLLKSVRTAL